MSGKLEVKTGLGGSTGETAVINAQDEILTCDVEGMKNLTAYISQDTDNGTGTFLIEISADGTNWAPFASKAASDMLAGSLGAVAVGVSDANGMPLAAKQLRCRCSALSSTAAYRFKVAGYRV